MSNIKVSEGSEPDSPMWRCRARAIAYGRVPAHQKGELVWVWFCERWLKASIRRSIPGGCYLADLGQPVGGCKLVTVAANTYGGYVEDAE